MSGDSRHEALKKMAVSLANLGRTRDTSENDLDNETRELVIGIYINSLVEDGDLAYAFEFMTETRLADRLIKDFALALISSGPSCDQLFTRTAKKGGVDYGRPLIAEALALLPSEAELTESTMIDAEIDARRESA